jgi:hypothetical protein
MRFIAAGMIAALSCTSAGAQDSVCDRDRLITLLEYTFEHEGDAKDAASLGRIAEYCTLAEILLVRIDMALDTFAACGEENVRAFLRGEASYYRIAQQGFDC